LTNLLNKKVVVVTGGAGLLGKTFIEAVLSQGGTAIIADTNDAAGLALLESVKKNRHSHADFVNLDITSLQSISKLVDSISGKYGQIDALVNSAYPRNRNYGNKFEDVTYDDFCKNVSMHLGGYFLTTQQLGIYFKKQGHGNIINLASIYGSVAPRFDIYGNSPMTMPVEYAAIKSAVIQLTRYAAKYFKGFNIRVNSISPGGIYDGQPENFVKSYNMHGLTKGMLNPGDVTGTLVYLLSDLSTYVNGQNIVVDDGWSL
jgi:NAD(P)-dependent dehydrogenase (short-subunit alcohol dehydrogenase family)